MEAGVYEHYKGGLYQVLGVAQHTETDELLVVYVSLTGANQPGPRIRCRPLHGPDGFDTYVRVQPPSGDDSGNLPRFRYVGVGT